MMTLAMANSGETVKLVQIAGGQGFKSRMAQMGLLPGVSVTVLNGNMNGPVIIQVNDSKIALGRGMAHKIHVSL